MGPLGFPELILIFIVALIVFGPRRLPEIGRTLGKALGEFKKATEELKNTIEREVHVEEMRKITPVVVAPVQTVSRTEPGIMMPAVESAEQLPRHDSSGQLIDPVQGIGMQHQLPANFVESSPQTSPAIDVEAVHSIPTGEIEPVRTLPSASAVTASTTSASTEPAVANEPHAG